MRKSEINSKKWVFQWKCAAEKLKKQHASELAKMTDARAREISTSLLNMAAIKRLRIIQRPISGLVKQQEYFKRWMH